MKPTDAIKIDRMKARVAQEIDALVERAIKSNATGRVMITVAVEMPVSQGGLGTWFVDGSLRQAGG